MPVIQSISPQDKPHPVEKKGASVDPQKMMIAAMLLLDQTMESIQNPHDAENQKKLKESKTSFLDMMESIFATSNEMTFLNSGKGQLANSVASVLDEGIRKEMETLQDALKELAKYPELEQILKDQALFQKFLLDFPNLFKDIVACQQEMATANAQYQKDLKAYQSAKTPAEKAKYEKAMQQDQAVIQKAQSDIQNDKNALNADLGKLQIMESKYPDLLPAFVVLAISMQTFIANPNAGSLVQIQNACGNLINGLNQKQAQIEQLSQNVAEINEAVQLQSAAVLLAAKESIPSPVSKEECMKQVRDLGQFFKKQTESHLAQEKMEQEIEKRNKKPS